MLATTLRLKFFFKCLDSNCRSLPNTNISMLRKLLGLVKQEYDNFLFQPFHTDHRRTLSRIIRASVKCIMDFAFTSVNLFFEMEKCLIVWETLFYYLAMLLKVLSDSDVEHSKMVFVKNMLARTTCAAASVWVENKDYEKAKFYIAFCLSAISDHSPVSTTICVLSPAVKYEVQRSIMILQLYYSHVLYKCGDSFRAFRAFGSIQMEVYSFSDCLHLSSCLGFNFGVQAMLRKDYNAAVQFFKLSLDALKTSGTSSIQHNLLFAVSYALIKRSYKRDFEKALCAIEMVFADQPEALYFLSAIKTVFLSRKQKQRLEKNRYSYSIDIINDIVICHVMEACVIFPMRIFSLFMKKVENRLNVPQRMYFLTQKLINCLDFDDDIKEIVFVVEDAMHMLRQNENVPFNCITEFLNLVLKYVHINSLKGNYEQVLAFYQYCREACLLTKEDNSVWIEFHDFVLLKMCHCCLELKHMAEAEKILMLIMDKITKNVSGLHLALQIALRTNEELAEHLLSLIDALQESAEISYLLFSSYATASRSQTSSKLQTNILERILYHVPHDENPVLYWESVACLVRLYVIGIELGDSECVIKILDCAKKSYSILKCPETEVMSDYNISLCHWFREVCWNVALDHRVEIHGKFSLFLLCSSFITASPKFDGGWFLKLKSCLTMVFASGLKIVHLETDPASKTVHLRKIQDLGRLLQPLSDQFPNLADSEVTRLFLMYEFEICVLLKDPYADEMLDHALEAWNLDVKSLEMMAAIYYIHDGNDFQSIIRLLRRANEKIFNAQKPDYIRVSRNYRIIAELLFHDDEYSHKLSDITANGFCHSVLRLISQVKSSYPQDEVSWLMKKCWNYGVRKLASSRTYEARQWCLMAQSFMEQLTFLRPLYEEEMNEFIRVSFD